MNDLPVQPATTIGAAPAVDASARDARPPATPPAAAAGAPPPDDQNRVATTGGHLRAAYAQFTIEPDTHLVRVRIIDPSTKEIIREIPSEEMQRVARALRDYKELARRRQSPTRSGDR